MTIVGLTPSVIADQIEDSKVRDQIKRTIDRIFEENIRQGTTTIRPGIQAYTRVPLAESDANEITSFGSSAIPVLSEYLDAPKIRMRELALRCIALIGGPDAVRLLETTASSSKSQAVGVQAVGWLGSMSGK